MRACVESSLQVTRRWSLSQVARYGKAILPLGISCSIAACSRVDTVQLGRDSPPFGPFGAPHPLTELGTPVQNPTLTGDLLEIYFTSSRAGSLGRNDTWVAKRAGLNEPFGAPELVPSVNSSSEESSPAISADGLTLWFASNRSGGAGGMDIWESSRKDRNATWSDPKNVTELNTSGNELPRPPGNHALQMPMSSYDSDPNYQLELTTRTSVNAAWGKPVAIAELADAAMIRVDGFLTDDGTTLLFNNEQPDNTSSVMMRTWRLSTDEAFAAPVSLGDGLNAATLNRDPWLSPDGTRFFFSSDRSGDWMAYEADLDRDH